jgi:hypothetical protein
MIDDRLREAVLRGARRAGVHAMRSVGEAVTAVTAFVDEVGKAFVEPGERPEHIDVEPDDEDA